MTHCIRMRLCLSRLVRRTSLGIIMIMCLCKSYFVIRPKSSSNEMIDKQAVNGIEDTAAENQHSGTVVKRKVTELLFVIPTVSGEADQRDVIRKTWSRAESYGDACAGKVRVQIKFFVGTIDLHEFTKINLEREASEDSDIVLLEMKEDYFNLTLKSQLMLSWALANSRADYVIKVDTDTFVNLPKVCQVFSDPALDASYGGRCFEKPHVNRDLTHKFGVSRDEFPDEFYPPYCIGPFYFLSRRALPLVVAQFERTAYNKMEDVFVGACVRNAGLTPDFDTLFKAINSREPSKKASRRPQEAKVGKNENIVSYIAVHPYSTRRKFIGAHKYLVLTAHNKTNKKHIS